MKARTAARGERGRLALALIAAVLGPAALFGEASRSPAAAAADPPPAFEARATVPPEALAAMAGWVAQAMGEPPPAELPRIVFAARPEMAALRTGKAPEAKSARPLEVEALYDDVRRTVHLPEGWTGATPAEMSVLAHEMVHHVQKLQGYTFACSGEREAEAYDVQERWLARFGTSLGEAFGLNRIALFVLTRCGA